MTTPKAETTILRAVILSAIIALPAQAQQRDTLIGDSQSPNIWGRNYTFTAVGPHVTSIPPIWRAWEKLTITNVAEIDLTTNAVKLLRPEVPIDDTAKRFWNAINRVAGKPAMFPEVEP